MGSLGRRLERLEALEARPKPGGHETPRDLERYFHALQNAEREQKGLEFLPGLPYTEEDYRDDLTTIAAYRANLGWQTEEAQDVLDEWERDVNNQWTERNQT